MSIFDRNDTPKVHILTTIPAGRHCPPVVSVPAAIHGSHVFVAPDNVTVTQVRHRTDQNGKWFVEIHMESSEGPDQ